MSRLRPHTVRRAPARARTHLGRSAKAIASASVSAVSVADRHGRRPGARTRQRSAPRNTGRRRRARRSSAARTASPAAVVPAPPWWQTAAQRGNSQSCGISSTRWTCAGGAPAPSCAQPRATRPRTPARSSAIEDRRRERRGVGSRARTEARRRRRWSPAARNSCERVRWFDSRAASSRKTKPVTSIGGPQSSGLGRTLGDQR